VIKEMFDASVNGEAYDAERWGAYYKPYGLETPNAAPKPAEEAASAPAAPAVPFDMDEDTPVPALKAQGYVAPNSGAVAADEDEAPAPTAPVQSAPAKPSSQKAEDILAMIRNRQKS